MNRYSWWTNLIIACIALGGIAFSIPSFLPLNPAVQIAWTDVQREADDELHRRVDAVFESHGIDYQSATIEGRSLLIRFGQDDQELQQRAQTLLSESFGQTASVALNVVQEPIDLLDRLGARPVNLGLDLRGGVHFLMELDTDAMIEQRMESLESELKRSLREQSIRYGKTQQLSDGRWVLTLRRTDSDKVDALLADWETQFGQLEFEVLSRAGLNTRLAFQYPEAALSEVLTGAIDQNIAALRKRIDELGVSEPVIQRQGQTRILVQLPGVRDSAQARRIIGKTATLEFRLESEVNALPSEIETFDFKGEGGIGQLSTDVIIRGDNVINAQDRLDAETNSPVVSLTLDSEGGRRMFETTRDNLGKRMAILLSESAVVSDPNNPDEYIRTTRTEIVTMPVIRGNFGSSFQIEGVGNTIEAYELALVLRSGALAAPMNYIEERTIGATLGRENIVKGVFACILGLIFVVLFMSYWYRLMGVIASIAVVGNVVLLISLMSLLGATLTLPGIAGIVLTVGMSVDANVLIFARINEELRAGANSAQAIYSGYERAFYTILDANVTTLIAALVLYSVGTGPVRGFAVTLALGILTSMFTALAGTRAIVNVIYGDSRKPISI